MHVSVEFIKRIEEERDSELLKEKKTHYNKLPSYRGNVITWHIYCRREYLVWSFLTSQPSHCVRSACLTLVAGGR